VRPDLLTAAKALGGGLPVGAVVSSPELAGVLSRGDHGSTFAGAPITAAAALAALDVIDDPELLGRVAELGDRLRAGLDAVEGIEQVRGRGLMVGVSLADGLNAGEVASRALRRGLVINVPGERMLRFLPPLVIEEADVDRALAVVVDSLT
jgi:acetylornithine aminotransferase